MWTQSQKTKALTALRRAPPPEQGPIFTAMLTPQKATENV